MTASAFASFGIFERSSSSANGHGFGRAPEGPEAVGDDVVLVDAVRHAPVGLHLGQCLLPALLPVVAPGPAPRAPSPSGVRAAWPSAPRTRPRPVSPRSSSSTARERRESASRTSVGRVTRWISSVTSRVRLGAGEEGGRRRPPGRGVRALGIRGPSVRGTAQTRTGRPKAARSQRCSGSDLLSHPVTQAVPSAREGLTSGFEMGPGVSPPLWPPKRRFSSDPEDRSLETFETFRGCVPRAELGNCDSEREQESSPRPISTGQLHTLPCFHFRPINLVVCEGPYLVNPVGDLISRWASHLDAFSAYPFRTWLTSRAAGATTGTPEVRPPRSSRTRGSSSQISYAHSG